MFPLVFGPKCSIPRRRARHANHRVAAHGVTLIEVLFSMGIISVGLLGVLLIVPLAGLRTARGTIADGADRMGRNAIREFDVREMRQPNVWTRLNTLVNPQTYVQYPAAATVANPNPPPGHPLISSRSFCIDPLFIATYRENAIAAGTNVPVETEFFPYYAMTNVNTETRMQRVSLRNFPSGPDGMSVDQAYDVFSSGDDLVFDLPDDLSALPIQNFSSNVTKRQSEGQFSWIATLTPKQDTLIDGSTLAQNTDLYLLSIVVFHRRDTSMTMQNGDPLEEGPDNERLVEVASFDGAGYAGGDVLLRTISRTTPINGTAQHYAQDLEVREGQWVMLSAKVTTAAYPLHFFRWYRVVSADGGIDGNGPYTRNVTLQGPDWNVIAATPNTLTQCTLLNNVVAVYEKTIRLETSSLWTIQ